MMRIQYLNIQLDEKLWSFMKIVAIHNYLLCEVFSNRYIDITDSWMEYLALWIWFTSTLKFVDQLYQLMYHLEFRLVLFLLLVVRLQWIILSQCEVPQTKQSTLEIEITDISIGLFCCEHMLVDANNPLLSLVEDLRYLYIQYKVLLDDVHVRCIYNIF